MIFRLLILLLIATSCLCGDDDDLDLEKLKSSSSGVIVDLREPEYKDGTISSRQGGVIQALNVRIQAQNIVYKTKNDDGSKRSFVTAEGNVRLESCNTLFIGSKIEYDLTNNTGFVYDGRSSVYPWYFGGKIIQICNDGSYIIYDGFVTTSESLCPEWKVSVETARIFPNQDITAKDLTVKLGKIPVFWTPRLSTNLGTLNDIPIKYTLRWGGKQGSRIGMIYEIMPFSNVKTLLRLDYNFKRGLGGGFEVHYKSPDLTERFDSINYYANEQSPANEHINTRYRFQGRYRHCWRGGKSLFELKYDKLSDKEMATDYSDRGIDLEYARRTDILLHHQEKYWLGNVLIRPRINYFQTIKQELPTISLAAHPMDISSLGIITTIQANASYLDFQYASGTVNVKDFTATRVEAHSSLYRPFGNALGKLTPGISAVGIYYGNRPYQGKNWLASGTAFLEGITSFSKDYALGRHIVQPYFMYNYIIQPTIPPNEHYIFDISDGWYRVNTLRLGFQQDFLQNFNGCCIPLFRLDTYLWGLLDDDKIPKPFPKLTTNLSFNVGGSLHNDLIATWDLTHGGLGEFNYKTAWTVSKEFAIAAEYRQRNAYFWRKVDKENFVLDFFRSENQLLHSPVSDARRTLLLRFFYRFNHGLAFEWSSRLGWDRRNEPFYLEYNMNILARLPAHWEMKISYQHKEEDDRFAVYFTLGMSCPKRCVAPSNDCPTCVLWY